MSKTVWGPLYYMILKRSTVSDWPVLSLRRGAVRLCRHACTKVCLCVWTGIHFESICIYIYNFFYIGMCCVFVLMKQHFAEGQFWWRAALVFFSLTKSAINSLLLASQICIFACFVHLLWASLFFWIVGWMKQAVGICLLLGKGTVFWHLINKQLIYNEDKTGRFMDTEKKKVFFSSIFFFCIFLCSVDQQYPAPPPMFGCHNPSESCPSSQALLLRNYNRYNYFMLACI